MEDLKTLISSHNNKVARIALDKEKRNLFGYEFDKKMEKADEDLKAIIVRVTDEILMPMEEEQAGMTVNSNGIIRNELRKEQRIKRDELLSK